jgi:DNA-binding NarL/FixJ family response regulator
LKHISNGLTNCEISELLFISKRTVEGHRQNLIEKTKVKNTASLVRFAVQNGLV